LELELRCLMRAMTARAVVAAKNTHSNAPNTVMACREWQGEPVQALGPGSSAPRAMKPANQKIIVTASTATRINLCAKSGKNLTHKARYGTARRKVQRPLKSMKLASSISPPDLFTV